jgi:hypothetical protein
MFLDKSGLMQLVRQWPKKEKDGEVQNPSKLGRKIFYKEKL